MKSLRHRNAGGLGRATLLGAAGLLMLTFTAPADAAQRGPRGVVAGHSEHGPSDRGHRRDSADRDRRQRRDDRRQDLRFRNRRIAGHLDRRFDFEVPRRLRGPLGRNYVSYREGRVYYRPHRHHHEVYYFPVRTPRGWELKAHFYCEGGLFGDGHVAYRGPNLGFDLHF